MIELVSKESGNTNVINHLLGVLLSADNIIEIVAAATMQLSHAVKCDHVNILLNNEKARNFSINHVLNRTIKESDQDVVIPYHETSITEILHSHRPILRNDLTGRDKFTPGDLRFLPEHVKSDLSVPVLIKNHVIAVLNLSSYQSEYFTRIHQEQIEQVAALLALAFERSEFLEKLNEKKSDMLLWKNKFAQLIKHTSQAVAVIQLDYDLIYESNLAFQKLTGYSSDQLQGMRLLQLHSQQQELILLKLNKDTFNGKAPDFDEFVLTRENGLPESVKVKFVNIGNKKNRLVLALYEKAMSPPLAAPLSPENKQSNHDIMERQLSVLAEIIKIAHSGWSLDELIRAMLVSIKIALNYDYAQLTLCDRSGENVQHVTIISDRCRELDSELNWNIIENNKLLWYHIARQNLRQGGGQYEFSIQSIEAKMQSRMPAVIMFQNDYSGTLALGSLEPNCYQKNHIHFMEQVAMQIGIAIESTRLHQNYCDLVDDHAIREQLKSMIGFDVEIENVALQMVQFGLKKMAAKLCTIHNLEINPTLPEMILSDPGIDKLAVTNFENKKIIARLMNLDGSYLIDHIDCDNDRLFEELNIALIDLKSYLSIPLKLSGKIIGTLTFYWDKPKYLNVNESNLVNAIARQVSEVFENANYYQEKIVYSRQLEHANSELENLIFSISNDLRSSLAAIQGFSSILLDSLKECINDDGYKYLERIRRHTINMQRLIHKMIEFSRLERLIHPFEMIDMGDVIFRATQESMASIKQKRIKLTIDKNLPRVHGDARWMEQVFTNLVDNAIKYCGADNKRPRIRIGYQDKNEKHVFYVSDNGMGIKKELHDYIFRFIHRIDHQEDDHYHSRLGLVIVKKIIEQHRGELWVESEEGKGSTFYFSLPRQEVNSSN